MADDQITALAREYAEEIYPNLSDKIISLRTLEIKNAERLIRFLLRRYALVEKSTIKEAWSMITGVYLDHDHITYDGARYLFDEVLFPDLGKEVEDEHKF